MKEAKGSERLDDKLALLWVKFCPCWKITPDRIDLHLQVAGMIARLTWNRYAITPKVKIN